MEKYKEITEKTALAVITKEFVQIVYFKGILREVEDYKGIILSDDPLKIILEDLHQGKVILFKRRMISIKLIDREL